MNKIILTGRLTRDADYREGNTNLARFTLAVDRAGEGADFPSCKAFGKTADIISKYTHKGSRIGIEGHLQTGSYQDRDGRTVYTTDVICDRVELLDPKTDANASTRPRERENVRGRENPEAQTQKRTQALADRFFDGFEGVDETLPFD